MTQPTDLDPIAAVASPDHNKERLATLKKLFPDLFTVEGRISTKELEKLAEAEGVNEAERYEFRWFGKTKSKRNAFTPSTAALVHDAARSVNSEKADGNMIIEGENLEVLKLLTSAYRESIKCIYIDPPYNTGNDFVYSDNYSEDRKPYWAQTGVTEAGVKVDSNSQSDGRYHSTWLSMIHSRLLLGRYLLKPDGVILVSIDDHEYQNLKPVLDEVFGPENFIATLIWEKGRKNDARFFSVGHEYLVVFAKDLQYLKDNKTVWRQPKPGAQEIWEQYLKLKSELGDDFAAIEARLTDWFGSLSEKQPAKKLARYRRVDKFGPWRDRDISWPGGGGPRYDVIHPTTKQPCKVPERGWGFSKPEEMQRQIDLGLVVFREDHTEPPFRKAHLKPIPDELIAEDDDSEISDGGGEDEELATQVRGSYFYAQSQVAVKFLRKLMGGKAFPNPKDHNEIAKVIDYVTGGGNGDTDDIVLDFFGGSGTTAHAVIDLNAKKGGRRRFILVQLPELIGEKDPAFKMDFRRLSDVTIKRVTNVIENFQKEAESLLPNDAQRQFADGLGFKVYTLAKSSFPRVEYAPNPEKTKDENIELLKQYIDDKEQTMFMALERDKIVDEVLLKNGFMLDYKLEPVAAITENAVVRVRDARKTALLCLDLTLATSTVAWFQQNTKEPFICLERALDTTRKWNLRHSLGDLFTAF